MGIRDEEIKRLEHYAKGLGLKVYWKKYDRKIGAGATWTTDGKEITIYTWANQSKTNIILNFIHELGHHLSWVYAGKTTDELTQEALQLEWEADPNESIPKHKRKLIYEAEKYDTKYRHSIWTEVGIKLPTYMLDADIELDVWIYREYYLKGKFPNRHGVVQKRNALLKKHKGKV